MRANFPTRITGQRGTLAVLEIEFTSKARRVVVRGFDGLEPLDLKGERPGGTYDVPDTLPRLHVPVRVTRDGPGRARLEVRVDDARGAAAPDTWQTTVTLDAPAAAAGRGQKAWLLGAFAAIVGAIAVFVVLPMFQATKVPKLEGRGEEEARRAARSQGYVVQTRFLDTDQPGEVGRVVQQSPAAGTELPRDSTVEITVGRAREVAAEVPDVVGKTADEAREALKAGKFAVTQTEEDAADDRAGRVIWSRPVAGTRLTEGAEIALGVGRRAVGTTPTPTPAADVALPDVLAKTADEARAALEAAGFVVKTTPAEGAAGDAGKVIAQSPPAGTAPKGSTITLTVVTPTGVPTVPPVPPSVPPVPPSPPPSVPPTPPPSVPPVPPSPPPSVPPTPPPAVPPTPPPAVPPTPPPPTPPPSVPPTPPTTAHVAPDVLGLDRVKAEAEIAKAGFTQRVEFEDTTDESDLANVVLKQRPAAGDPLAAGGTVELVVSRRAAPKGHTVPAVVGKSEVEARRLLAAETLAPKVTYTDAPAEKDGVVLTQDPPAGAMAGANAVASLTVGRYVPPVQPPPTPPSPPPSLPPTPPPSVPPTPPPSVPPTPPSPPPSVPPTPPSVPPTPPPSVPPSVPPPPPSVPPTPPPSVPPTPPPYVSPTPPPYVPPPTPPPTPPSNASLPPPIHVAPGQALPPPMRVGGAPAPAYTPAPAPRTLPPAGTTSAPLPRPTVPSSSPTTTGALQPVSMPGAGTPAPVPGVEGTTGADAVGRLVAAGFRPVVVVDRDPRASLGVIRTQSPRPGTPARRGDAVTIAVGGGFSPYSIDVPNVAGLRLNDATARLRGIGATASVIRVPGSGSPDVVLAQYPVGLFVREEARGVTLWVGDR